MGYGLRPSPLLLDAIAVMRRAPIMRACRVAVSCIALLALAAGAAAPADARPATQQTCDHHDRLRRPWFGDLHVHTAYSLDASTQGVRNRPAQAYRFARGERIGIQPYDERGRPQRSVQLARPLDFAAVTDHAELLGEWNICNSADLPGHGSLVCRIYRSWPRAAFFWMNLTAARGARAGFCGSDGARCLEAARRPWDDIRDAAAAAQDRSRACAFTSFVGYEWTGADGPGNNTHRNVIFRNETVPALPTSFIDAPSPQRLWAALREECTAAGSGCDAVVIPHNSNLSAGLMFQTQRDDGRPLDAATARQRAELEVLVEVMQHKGDSECMPGLGNEDELCGFEKLAMNNFIGRYASWLARPPLARQFVRNILKEGLAQEARIGVNPFRFGLIASTDTHLAAPGLVAEDAGYPGHGGAGIPAGDALPPGLPDAIDFNPGGLAVLWAEENSREALFGAMRRREVYGTSGPRLVVRFFGGWKLPDALCEQPGDGLVRAGYAMGVPMGSDLPAPPAGDARGAPLFAVSALRDPGVPRRPGSALQRVQIVKGWSDGDTLHERVYEVAGHPRSPAGVDLRSCQPFGPGFDSLCRVWRDPDFEPAQRAFYYARVLENPTCRWSQQLCVAKGVDCEDPDTIGDGLADCCREDHVRTIQERAWTSPIWYRPD